MNKDFQPISQKSKINNRFSCAFFLVCGLIMTALPLYILFTQGYSSLGWSEIVIMILGFSAIASSIFILSIKQELKPEAQKELKQQSKEWEERFIKKWYIRYLLSILALGWAYVCYKSYINGLSLDTFKGKGLILYLLMNPIIGVIMGIAAIIYAWEVFLIVILGVVLYYIYLGIAALPISMAIIFGSIIISYGIYKYKA